MTISFINIITYLSTNDTNSICVAHTHNQEPTSYFKTMNIGAPQSETLNQKILPQ